MKALEERLEEKKVRLARLQAQIRKAEATQKETERKRDIRRKIRAGEIVLSAMKDDPDLKERVTALLKASGEPQLWGL